MPEHAVLRLFTLFSSSYSTIGDQYFRLEKLRGWSGQQQQTLAGFEKIQTVGKGITN